MNSNSPQEDKCFKNSLLKPRTLFNDSDINVATPKKRKNFPLMREHSYIRDVLTTMFNEQSEHIYSKFSEGYLKYRQVVVEWMVDVADYFQMHITTTHAAIAYLDRIQPNDKFSRFEWQMLAITCILVAAKYNETEENLPQLRRIEEIAQQKITNECLLNYELWVLKKLSWKLNARTPASFITSYSCMGIFCYDENDQSYCEEEKQFKQAKAQELEIKAFQIATRCIVDPRFKPLDASSVAAAIVYYVRRNQYALSPAWDVDLTMLTYHDPTVSRASLEALSLICETEDNPEIWEEVFALYTDYCNMQRLKTSAEGESSFAVESPSSSAFTSAHSSPNKEPLSSSRNSSPVKMISKSKSNKSMKQSKQLSVEHVTPLKDIDGSEQEKLHIVIHNDSIDTPAAQYNYDKEVEAGDLLETPLIDEIKINNKNDKDIDDYSRRVPESSKLSNYDSIKSKMFEEGDNLTVEKKYAQGHHTTIKSSI